MACNWRNKHTLPSSILFFKIITTTSLQDGKFRIPNGFTRKHGGDMSNPVFLETPDGKEWKIHWTKHDGDIWFQKGWKEFATYYSLDHGHMVLFEYEETSHFGMHIFDKSTLEIEYRFHGSQDEQNILDQISDDDSVEILGELPPCRKTRPKLPMSCPQPHKKLRTDTSTEDVGRSSKLQNFPKHVQVIEDMGDTNECPKVKLEQLTSKITETLNRASNFRSKNPSFTVVMKPSDVDQFLNVPSQFATKYLNKKQRDIILQVLDGRTWPGKYCPGKINVGWKKFASDNNLKVGDVCLFELTNSQSLTLKVLIFRLGDEPHSPPPPQEFVQGDGVNWLDPTRTPYVESKAIITSKGDKATQRSPFANEALKEANKFTSENPIFTLNIKPNQWGDSRPRVPSAFIRKYLDKKKEIVMLQFGKKLWPVKLLCYPFTSCRLSRGWHLFTRENKLQGGDACVFELINREEAVFEVHIFRGHC